MILQGLLLAFQVVLCQSQDKWSIYWDDDAMRSSIDPSVRVQNIVGEGIGWAGSGSAEETSNHVVISVLGRDDKAGVNVPYAKRPLFVKATAPLACVIEQGNGDFEDCSMGPNQIQEFTTNAFGRVSFSVPLHDQLHSSTQDFILPAIMIQTEYMPEEEW